MLVVLPVDLLDLLLKVLAYDLVIYARTFNVRRNPAAIAGGPTGVILLPRKKDPQ